MSANPTAPRSAWRIVGYILAAVVAIGGLAVVAFAILFFVAMSQFGSNK